MNDVLKVFVFLGIILFILAGVATMFFLFGGMVLSGDSIAVIDMSGEISEAGPISAALMREMLNDVAEDGSVVAVVLKINSGGGGVIETKEIARQVSKLSESKPVIAYIGDMGASGAYYVAAFSDYIMSDEDSLIGSIGVISTYMSYQGLLEDKLGINTTVIKSGIYKDIGSPYKQMTDDEKTILQGIVDQVHTEFLEVIISRRSLTKDAIAIVNTSDIFLGSRALQLGLIDYTGGFEDALSLARDVAGSPDAEPYYLDASSYYSGDMYYNIGKGVGDALASKIALNGESLAFK